MVTREEFYSIEKKLSVMFKKLSEAKTREEKEAIYREAYPGITDEGIEILLED